MVPVGTARSMPSRTVLSPYVLRNPVAEIASSWVVVVMAQSVRQGAFSSVSRWFQCPLVNGRERTDR